MLNTSAVNKEITKILVSLFGKKKILIRFSIKAVIKAFGKRQKYHLTFRLKGALDGSVGSVSAR